MDEPKYVSQKEINIYVLKKLFKMESIRQIQDLFDANAENISNNDYIKICNSLKRLYEQIKGQEQMKGYAEEVDINVIENRINDLTREIIEESEKMWKFKSARKISPRVREWVWDNCEESGDYSIFGKSVEEYNKEAVEEYNKNIFRERLVHANKILEARKERKVMYRVIGFYYTYNEDASV